MNKYLFSLVATFLIISCSGTKKLVDVQDPYEERMLDTLMVVASKIKEPDTSFFLETYNASEARTIDLLHTKLDLRFDWENQYVLGIADLKLKPFFHSTSQVNLDAIGFDIHAITNLNAGLPLDFEYDGESLQIKLEKIYSQNDIASIRIEYTAKPEELPIGGSQAITSDKGLFFINPFGSDPDKPMQIWTQGETENNSRWFPTIDKPNERCTQETLLTVDQKYETLSNGKLVSSKENPDGTRTDYWVMSKPHAPYLFMIAVGEFAVVNETWNEIPVSYYVEPKYEKDAKAIFNHTPEMLSFFSEFTGVPYPWEKFSQIIVRDYVSGAMENTTAVIFGDFVQKTERELIDADNDYIVAHEMFHHWFGDFVTCESWSNLTLNEGFANYGEYLWSEYKYGKQAADHVRYNELRGYLNSAQNGGTHDLIDFEYDNREAMFDAHSYNKGGLVLHMLRNYVGENAFRASLKYYLEQNAFTSVEAHDLRLAFEKITGQDLNWFFNQWFFDKGHPNLEVNHSFSDGIYSIHVMQTQDPENNAAIFQLPLNVEFFFSQGKSEIKKIIINQRSQVFNFNLNEKPEFVNFDADNILLGTVKENLTTEENIFQYKNCKDFQDRYDALVALRGEIKAKPVFVQALNDEFFAIRRLAIGEINPSNDILINKLKEIAEKDPKSQVRSAAINNLSNIDNTSLIDFAENILKKEKVYSTYAEALALLYELDKEKGQVVAETLIEEENFDIVALISDIFSSSHDSKYIEFFEKKINSINGYFAYPIFGNYFIYLNNLPLSVVLESEDFLIQMAKNNASSYKRYLATITLNNLRESISSKIDTEKNKETLKMLQNVFEKTNNAILEIIEIEKNPQLLERYQGL